LYGGEALHDPLRGGGVVAMSCGIATAIEDIADETDDAFG
jgi:hypothetical protein